MSEQIIGNDRILSTKLLVKAISEGQSGIQRGSCGREVIKGEKAPES